MCAAAPELAGQIVVLDKAAFPRDKICAGAIGARADALLARIGARVEVEAAPIRGLHVKSATGELTARRPASIGRVVRRHAFDAALLDLARARGVTVRERVRVTGLSRSARSVTLSTDHGALTAAAVVGADGVGSVVRRALGFSRGTFHAQAVEVDTPRVPSDPPDDVLSFDVTDRGITGYAWDFPTLVAGEPMMCRGAYVLTRGAPSPEPQRDAGDVLAERLQRLGVTGRLKRFAERGLSLYEPLAVDKVLLVGEAAGIDPVLGEGIPQAIFYGETAAAYLVRCAREGDYRFTGYRRAMRKARIGTDLRIRAAAVSLIYGRTRPPIERWVTSSHALAQAGMSYFAGERVGRCDLARASLDLVVAAAG